MDLQHLSLLRELADRGSVTAVAAASHRSPSAVSQQLATLQRQLGTDLVRRSGRGIELTDAGRTLADAAVGVARAVAEAEATWHAFVGGASGTVRLAVFPSVAELLVPGLVHRMRAHPGIDLVLGEHDVSEHEFAPLVVDHDVVVGHRSDGATPPDRAGLDVVPLLREPLDVAVPPGHVLDGRPSVSLEEVVEHPWVGVPEGYPLDRVLTGTALRTGVTPTVVFRSLHLPLLENMVAAGHGLALLPRHTSRARVAGRVHLARLDDLRAGRHVEALMRPDRASRLAVRTVVDELRAEVAAALREDGERG